MLQPLLDGKMTGYSRAMLRSEKLVIVVGFALAVGCSGSDRYGPPVCGELQGGELDVGVFEGPSVEETRFSCDAPGLLELCAASRSVLFELDCGARPEFRQFTLDFAHTVEGGIVKMDLQLGANRTLQAASGFLDRDGVQPFASGEIALEVIDGTCAQGRLRVDMGDGRVANGVFLTEGCPTE